MSHTAALKRQQDSYIGTIRLWLPKIRSFIFYNDLGCLARCPIAHNIYASHQSERRNNEPVTHRILDRPGNGQYPSGAGSGELGVASAIGGAPRFSEAAEAATPGSSLLGRALSAVEGMAGKLTYCTAGHGGQFYWRWKSRCGQPGRPRIKAEIRELIIQISRENPLWGSPRIVAELHLLGYDVAKSTVEQYRVRGTQPPSQTWRTFLGNHVQELVSIDFFTVPTVRFRVLFCFLVLRHDRRRVVHFNVSEHPTATWTAQQIIEAFPWNEAPRT